jgi:Putative Ig domain
MARQAKGLVSVLLLASLPLAFHGCSGASKPEAALAQSGEAADAADATDTATQARNRPPTIDAARDEYARVGETFAYQPAARDADGDSLRYSAENLPPWASMDPTNGRITGTPGPADLGVYELIIIRVADAARSAQTAPFSITVIEEAAGGVASLRWEVPPSKVDGSPLDDLAGYRIVYGRSSEDLDRSVFIDNAATTHYEFTGLTSGIWYFAVIAVNANGLEGPPTTITTKSI